MAWIRDGRDVTDPAFEVVLGEIEADLQHLIDLQWAALGRSSSGEPIARH